LITPNVGVKPRRDGVGLDEMLGLKPINSETQVPVKWHFKGGFWEVVVVIFAGQEIFSLLLAGSPYRLFIF
jgi:hypothetical protein